jgi:hypothetical protein
MAGLVLHYRKRQDGTVTVGIVKDGKLWFDPPEISVPVEQFLNSSAAV